MGGSGDALAGDPIARAMGGRQLLRRRPELAAVTARRLGGTAIEHVAAAGVGRLVAVERANAQRGLLLCRHVLGVLQVRLHHGQHLYGQGLEVCVLRLGLGLLKQLLDGFVVADARLLDVAAVESVTR